MVNIKQTSRIGFVEYNSKIFSRLWDTNSEGNVITVYPPPSNLSKTITKSEEKYRLLQDKPTKLTVFLQNEYVPIGGYVKGKKIKSNFCTKVTKNNKLIKKNFWSL